MREPEFARETRGPSSRTGTRTPTPIRMYDETRAPAEPNEVRVITALRRARVPLTLSTTVDDEPISGRIAWTDINNIALEIGGRVRVFLKSQIVYWDYDQALVDKALP